MEVGTERSVLRGCHEEGGLFWPQRSCLVVQSRQVGLGSHTLTLQVGWSPLAMPRASMVHMTPA